MEKLNTNYNFLLLLQECGIEQLQLVITEKLQLQCNNNFNFNNLSHWTRLCG